MDLFAYMLGKKAGGGGSEPTGTIDIFSNGVYNVKNYASADVNVPNTYTASDEGKVVNNGALVAQTSVTKTANGTYDTTLNNEVVVDVEGYTVERIDESGSIVSFETEFDDIPLSDIVADIEPVQDLHGYDKPWSGGNGKNLLPMTIESLKSDNTSGTWSGNTYSYNGGTFAVQSDSDGNVTGVLVNCDGTNSGVPALYMKNANLNGSFIINGCPSGGSWTPNTWRLRVAKYNGTYITQSFGGDTSFTTDGGVAIQINIGEHYAVSNLLFKPMLRLATESDASFAPYTNICPISGWDETKVYVSPTTSEQDATVYTIDLDGTRYGGTLDVTSGVLTVDRAIVDMGMLTWYKDGCFYATVSDAPIVTTAGLPSNLVSDRYETVSSGGQNAHSSQNGVIYRGTSSNNPLIRVVDTNYSAASDFKTAVSGSQLVYELATPITVQLTPTQVQTISGTNHVWADSGDVEVETIEINAL